MENGKARSRKMTDEMGTHEIALTNSQDETCKIIPQIEATKQYRTLGAHISSEGIYDTQLKIINQQTNDWVQQFTSILLVAQEKLDVYNQYIMPKITLTASCIGRTSKMFAKTKLSATRTVSNIMGLNRHFLCTIMYAGKEYFGLEIRELALEQG